MEQKMKSTVIQLKTSQVISFHRVISYTKFGYNAVFHNSPTQSSQISEKRYFDVYAFSLSLLHINNLKSHIEEIIKLYSRLNNSKILCPILEKIQDKDMLYLVSSVQKHSLKELIERREGLTEYEVVYFIMELYQILSYCKSREVYFEKIQLSNLYLNDDMKLSLPFSMFLNTAVNKPIMKRLPFRNEAKNRNICPELFCVSDKVVQKEQTETKGEERMQGSQDKRKAGRTLVNVHMVNSWNMGVLIYELLENCKPFETNCAVPIFGHSSNLHQKKESGYHEGESRKFYALKFYQTESTQARELIMKLLQVEIRKRLNFPLILIEAIFKKVQQIPHILPSTILTCPPSEEFKQSYRESFPKQKLRFGNNDSQVPILQRTNTRSLKKGSDITRTQIVARSNSTNHIGLPRQSYNQQGPIRITPQYEPQSTQDVNAGLSIPNYQTQKYIKASERSLTENKVYVEEFVDISHVYGFGYQMNTGTLCFVFNDETEFYFPNSNRKFLFYVNGKKAQTLYTYDKLPEEQDLKKKILILQAYSKSIKKFKTPTQSPATHEKIVTVLRYGKTKHASMFYLSNDSIQVFFNDKICFLMTKSNLYVLSKNTDKYQKYDYRNQTNEMKTRRDYVVVMAKKIFGWKKERESQIEEGNQIEARDLGRKKSLGQEDEANTQSQREQRVRSLKEVKEKQQRNYHMMKKASRVSNAEQSIFDLQ